MPFLTGLDNKIDAFELYTVSEAYDPKMIECRQNHIVTQLHQTYSSE
jgi:hypothetical protein